MKELLKIDILDILVLLRPWKLTALHLNLYAHLGCRRYISIHAHASASVRSEETEDLRALDWCPRAVVFPH